MFRKIDTPHHLITFLQLSTVVEALAIFAVLDIIVSNGILIGIPISKHLVKVGSPYCIMCHKQKTNKGTQVVGKKRGECRRKRTEQHYFLKYFQRFSGGGGEQSSAGLKFALLWYRMEGFKRFCC